MFLLTDLFGDVLNVLGTDHKDFSKNYNKVCKSAVKRTAAMMKHFAKEGEFNDFQYFICGGHIGFGVCITKYVGKDDEVLIPVNIDHSEYEKTFGKIAAGIDVYPTIMIGNEAFYDRTDITFVYIPRAVKEIGRAAFCGCSNLIKIEMPEEINEIKVSTFANCERLKSIELPDYVYEIGVDVFKIVMVCHR